MADRDDSQVDLECSLHVQDEALSFRKYVDTSNTCNTSVVDGDDTVGRGGCAAALSTAPAVVHADAKDAAVAVDNNSSCDGGGGGGGVGATAADSSAVASDDDSGGGSSGGGGCGGDGVGVGAGYSDAAGSSGVRGRYRRSYRDTSKTILWCVPRTVSTALTKCLSAIEGNQVWFEPFFFCHFAALTARDKLKLELPPMYEGNEEVYRQAISLFDELYQCKSNPEFLSYTTIKRLLEESDSRHVFVKDMESAICDEDHYKFIPDGFAHAFLIRHPLRVFASLRKLALSHLALLGEPADKKTFDIGRENPFTDRPDEIFKDIFNIWKYVRETSDTGPPVVIDSDDLLTKPAEVFPKFCEAVRLPFDDSLLKWDPSTEVTKKWMFFSRELIEKFTHAYERAITSSEFIPLRDLPGRDHVTPDVIRCADEVMKYYNEMYAARLKP